MALVPRPSRVLLFLAFMSLSAAVQLAAQTVQFVATVNGEPKAGAEVCFFRALRSENPVVLFGQDDRVVCLPADAPHEMRAGEWAFYAEHPSGYVSAGPDVMFVEGRSPREKGVSSELRKAGTLDFGPIGGELAPGEHFAVYVSNVMTESALPAIRPLPHGKTRMYVPAGERVLPLVVKAGHLLRVGQLETVEPDQTIAVRSFSRHADDSVDVVSWIKIDYSIFDRVRDKGALSPLDVVLTTEKGATVRPILPPRRGAANELSLQVFKNVPLGRHKLTLRGESWETATLDVLASAGSTVFMTDEPLRAAPAGRVSVRWRLPESINGLLAERSSCAGDSRPAAASSIALAVLACPSVSQKTPSETIELTTCRLVANWPIPATDDRGTKVVTGLPARVYVAALRLPHVGPTLATFFAAPGETTTVDIAPVIRSVFGRVTRGNEPVHAEIAFSTGNTVSDASGDYTALLTESPGADRIIVKPCDGSAAIEHQPSTPIALNTRYDVILENTAVNVTVRDAKTGDPLERAIASFSVFDDKNERLIRTSGAARPTPKNGQAVFEALPSSLPLVVCAEMGGYRETCTKRFTLTKDERRDVELKLDREAVFEGKVTGVTNLQSAMLFWITPTGDVTEDTTIASDGTFVYRKTHAEGEAAVIVSGNAPLRLFPSGVARGDRVIEFQFDNAPLRRFTVDSSRGGQDTAYLGLWIGGYPIPSQVLDRHQSFRRLRTMILRGEPVVISDVTQTGPIEVTLGPDPRVIPKDLPADWFAVPTYAQAFPRKALRTDNRISF